MTLENILKDLVKFAVNIANITLVLKYALSSLVQRVGKMNESCVVIGYPNGQDLFIDS